MWVLIAFGSITLIGLTVWTWADLRAARQRDRENRVVRAQLAEAEAARIKAAKEWARQKRQDVHAPGYWKRRGLL